MKYKYEVTIKEIEVYVLNVEAGSEDEAEDIAYRILEDSDKKHNYHHDSDSEASVYEQD